MIKLTTFRWVPPFAQGLVRDVRVRWALEEAELKYEVKLVGQDDLKTSEYRKLQPFGQVPVLEDGDTKLFESGAIVLHIAEKTSVLMPTDPQGKARTRTWVFAAIDSIERQILNLNAIDLFNADKAWAIERRPEALSMVKDRLNSLEIWLENKKYLEGDTFTAGDLMMTCALRNLRHIDLVKKEFVKLNEYVMRCESRPAFQKALNDHMLVMKENAPTKS